MATKYGQDAIRAMEDRKLVFKTRLQTIAVIIAVGIAYMCVDHYIF